LTIEPNGDRPLRKVKVYTPDGQQHVVKAKIVDDYWRSIY
jgi:hypothetical protein